MDLIKLSNSEIQAFKDCPRKWWLRYYRELGTRKQEQVGIRMLGTRVHIALYEYYMFGTDPRLTLARLAEEDSQLLGELDDRKKFDSEIELAKRIVEGYLEWLAETGADSELEVTSGETYLEREFYGVLLIGKIDLRVLHAPTGTRWILDHKTVQNFEDHTFNLVSNEQMLHYLTLEQEQPEGPAVGALYNMMRKVKRSATAKPPFYQRREIRYNEHQLRNFQERLRGVIDNILFTRAQLDAGINPMQVVYPRPSQDCSWKCDFRLVCPMFDDGSRVEAMLDQYYEKVDPHAHYQV